MNNQAQTSHTLQKAQDEYCKAYKELLTRADSLIKIAGATLPGTGVKTVSWPSVLGDYVEPDQVRSYLTTRLDEEQVQNILADASYNIAYWCQDMDVADDSEVTYDEACTSLIKSEPSLQRSDSICFEDVLARVLFKGGSLKFVDEDGEAYEMTLASLNSGFRLNVKNRPFDCDLDSGDGITVDCIVQYALFGELVYG